MELNKTFQPGERFRLKLGVQFDNAFNHPMRAPSDDQYLAWLGTLNLAVNQATRKLQIASLDRNLDFGHFFESFNQEGVDSRRTIRLTLRFSF